MAATTPPPRVSTTPAPGIQPSKPTRDTKRATCHTGSASAGSATRAACTATTRGLRMISAGDAEERGVHRHQAGALGCRGCSRRRCGSRAGTRRRGSSARRRAGAATTGYEVAAASGRSRDGLRSWLPSKHCRERSSGRGAPPLECAASGRCAAVSGRAGHLSHRRRWRAHRRTWPLNAGFRPPADFCDRSHPRPLTGLRRLCFSPLNGLPHGSRRTPCKGVHRGRSAAQGVLAQKPPPDGGPTDDLGAGVLRRRDPLRRAAQQRSRSSATRSGSGSPSRARSSPS